MAILWLGFMSLFLGALAIPVVQHFMYSAGRFGLVREIIEGFLAFLLEVSLFSITLGIAGFFVFGPGGAVVMGLTGVVVSFIVVGILGAFSAVRQWRVTG
jgi:hypothetical protein